MFSLPDRSLDEKEIKDSLHQLTRDYPVGDYNVYTISCQFPKSNAEKLQWIHSHEEYDLRSVSYPSWVDSVLAADEIYYVGFTDDVPDRLLKHVKGLSDSANFTEIFNPEKVVSITSYSDIETAKSKEMERAYELTDHEYIDKLTENPIALRFVENLNGQMKFLASSYLKKDQWPTKSDIYNRWKKEFQERYIEDMIESGVKDEYPEIEDAYETWLNSNPFIVPESPQEKLTTEEELLEYWDELSDHISHYVNELNNTYHTVVYDQAENPIKYAYAF